MQAAYRIPKHTVRVEVHGADIDAMVTLFLAERAANHAGPEHAQDLLNGPHDFFPAQLDDGRFLFLCRHSIRFLRVPPEDEADAIDPGNDVVRPVVLTFDDGCALEATARYQLPDASRRLQDFLNQPDEFLTLYQDDGMLLVNKRRVAHVWER